MCTGLGALDFDCKLVKLCRDLTLLLTGDQSIRAKLYNICRKKNIECHNVILNIYKAAL